MNKETTITLYSGYKRYSKNIYISLSIIDPMKRKIIKQGHNTLTITLPTKWTKQFNLKAGDEVEISERNNGLFINTERQEDLRSITIDIQGLDIPTIWKYFMAVYREGYDEVRVNFDPRETYDSPYKFFSTQSIDAKYGKRSLKHTTYETIQEITNRFIGYEIIEHHSEYCLIKDLAEISSKEFESSLRRIFLLIQQMAEETLDAIKTNNHPILRNLHDIDINVDKFHDYCVRVLNKKIIKETRKTNLMFTTLYILELLADEFKSIAHHIIEDMKGKKLDNLQPICEIIIEQFNQYYEVFYKFEKQKIVDMSKNDINIYFYLPGLYKKKPGKRSELTDDELEVFNHFRRIGKYINALTELRIEMEF